MIKWPVTCCLGWESLGLDVELGSDTRLVLAGVDVAASKAESVFSKGGSDFFVVTSFLSPPGVPTVAADVPLVVSASLSSLLPSLMPPALMNEQTRHGGVRWRSAKH